MGRLLDTTKPKAAVSKSKATTSVISIGTIDSSDSTHMQSSNPTRAVVSGHSRTDEPLGDDERLMLREALEVLRTLRRQTTTTQTEVHSRLATARDITAFIDRIGFMSRVDHYDDQIFIVSELQSIAYHDTDHGGVQDIAQWCVRAWLQLLASRSEELPEVLTGMSVPHKFPQTNTA